MRRPDGVTTTIWLAVVVAMVLAFSLQREVTTVLPYFGFERRQDFRGRGAVSAATSGTGSRIA